MVLAPSYLAAVRAALAEDLGSGDLSTEATVPPDIRASARAVARKPLVVCGRDVFFAVFREIDPSVTCEAQVDEGVRVDRGAVLWRVAGAARSLLMAERVALNFAQRMSGVATITRSYVEALVEGSPTRIADTRKTTPGLRMLERYAVRVGGGHNHRDNLGSAVMIKDNHIVAAGGIARAVARARAYAPHTSRIEVEVASLQELDEALQAQADIIMLDNFTDDQVAMAVSRAKGKAILEVSGGVTLERIRTLSALGVDVISVGALTHSAPSADIALDLEVTT
jgi:nicotinate-nucleotide pyrophosphorylase (carboxylating)